MTDAPEDDRIFVPAPRTYREKSEYMRRVLDRGRLVPVEVQCEHVRRAANRLIERLYTPDSVGGWARGTYPEPQIAREPINWGDLNADVAMMADGTFLVTVEEAPPDACPELCAYIERWLTAWGWPCRVVTEW